MLLFVCVYGHLCANRRSRAAQCGVCQQQHDSSSHRGSSFDGSTADAGATSETDGENGGIGSSDLDKRHPIEYAIDGTARWWQSPTLLAGKQFEYVTITLDLKQVGCT